MSKKMLFNVFLFTTGAAIGSLVTWKVVKTKYERIAQEEIDSVKEMWASRMREEYGEKVFNEEDTLEEDDYDEEFDDEEMIDYNRIASRYRTSGEEAENGGEGEGDEEVPYIDGPYVITPDEYGNGSFDHNLCTLSYYSDGVLADDWDVEVDIEETVGSEALKHIGEYAEDIVHVRNERLKIDYEIARDPRKYADVILTHPLSHAYEN